MIGDKSLSCGADEPTERHLDVCLTPRPLRSSHDLYCMCPPSYWVVLQENVCHQPLNMCLNDISPVCLWEMCLCRRIEMRPIRLEVQIVFEDKTSKRQIVMGDEILLPTVCWWTFVPWFCGLNCMPVLILSYQSDVFGICTQLSHSTWCKTGTICSIADEYGYS